MHTKDHWERVYASKAADEVSWYQRHAARSLRMIRATGVPLSAPIIDVGGGASRLAEDLLQAGFTALTVLDISACALEAAKRRLGPLAPRVTWREADITSASLPPHAYDLWHDRAVFHFLTSAADRRDYVAVARHAVRPGGHLVIATFAEDGPSECSGLPVMRYTAARLLDELGAGFTLVRHETEAHRTPAGKLQHFIYCRFQAISC